MAKGKSHTYNAGDKVKLAEAPKTKKKTVRIGDNVTPGFFAAVFEAREGAIRYGKVYQVSGKEDIAVVDNDHRPLPFIAKDFVNHPVFKPLFIAVKDPDTNNNKKEDS